MMKKTLFLPLVLVIIATSVFYSSRVSAFELGVGAYSYYNWRDFAWSDADNIKIDPLLQAGPVINMTWNHTVSLSLSFLTPMYISHADYDYKPLVSNYKVHVDNANISKSDIDVALSYLVSPGFKVFGGFKLIKTELLDGARTASTGADQIHFTATVLSAELSE